MARAKKEAAWDELRIITLLRSIPTEVFVQMVSKSGLPTHEARELCKEFKDLK